MRLKARVLTVAACSAAALLASAPVAGASSPTVTFGPNTYSINPAGLDAIGSGPWTLSQPDTAAGQAQDPITNLLPTYTPTGSSTSTQLTNLAAYPGATVGTAPYQSGQPGTPGPVDGYCASGGAAPESGAPVKEPSGINEPMSPYYFPFIQKNADGTLTGYFDYRPKDTDEAVVSANSTDGGKTWTANGQALEQNQGYCPDGDVNDNGQGHSFVMSVGGQTNLYTLNRVAGDNIGVGLLVHGLTGGERAPLAGLPASQSVGTDPDSTATSTVAVPATGASGVAIPLASLGTAGTPTQLTAGHFVDEGTGTAFPDVITCSGTGASSLTGCTAATAETVNSNDMVSQVVSTVQSTVNIPRGPNNAAENGGTSITIAVPPVTIATAEEANLGAGRVYVDSQPVYCVGDTVATTTITLTGCTTPGATGLTAIAGDPVTLDPITPSGTQMTTGLDAPDGIVGTLPSYPGAPAGSTVVLYGEKILSYYSPTTTAGTFALPATGSSVSIPVASLSFLSSPLYSQLSGFTPSGGTPTTFSFGDASSSSGFASLSCTGYTASPATLTGCTTVTGNSGDSIASGSNLAIPGAALVPGSVLGLTGEGSTKAKTLYKNNEDYTVLRAAYTTDGVNFSDTGLANGGLISGSNGSQDVNNPAATASPSATAPFNNPVGATEPTELRYVGTRGSIIQNGDGSETMFLSGAWATDGDSDAFNQVFETTSTDGQHWSTPTTVVSTDYTFSARANQDAALATGSDQPLNVSGYYSGRTYSPAAVKNADGSITLVMSGYSTPKPLPVVGSLLGTGTTQWKVTPSDPALYRNILTLSLTPQPAAATPEAPLIYVLPVIAAGLLGAGALINRRRRTA